MRFKIFALAALAATAAFAQDITGTWQGTLQTPQRALRMVMKVTRTGDNLRTVFYSIDQNGQGIPASAPTFQGGTIKAAIPAIGGTYEGKLSADGNSITGTFTQGGALPLNFVKATPTTEWVIPEPPAAPKPMAADAKPSFEVATIKPSKPDAQGQSIQVGRPGGGVNSLTTENTPVFDLIKFAYGVHSKQVTGGPSWIELEKYDILAKPDTQGIPNINQLRTMVQKLLADRFGLEFHREKRELSAYILTADKAGLKIAKVEGNRGNLPGFGGRGIGAVGVFNSNMAEFAEFLQSRILERPVVDQTGLTDRYDFTIEWKPDMGQLAMMTAPNPPPQLPQNVEDRPDLMGAMRKLGLKLESGKTPVEVLVIDKVTKPTEN